MKQKISINSLWRNSEKYARRTLESFDEIENSGLFDVYYHFYENDSEDSTVDIISNWIKSKNGVFKHENLKVKHFGRVVNYERFCLLSMFRNKLNKISCDDKNEITLLLDSDVIFNTEDLINIIEVYKQTKAKMVVANTRQNIQDLFDNCSPDSFYDVLPLKDYYNNDCLYFRNCPMPNRRDVLKWSLNQPIKIKSGFSGFSLIETETLKKCKWSSFGNSEHINFCTEVNDYGDIYIAPSCRPRVYIENNDINIDSFTYSCKRQSDDNEKINNIYINSIKNI